MITESREAGSRECATEEEKGEGSDSVASLHDRVGLQRLLRQRLHDCLSLTTSCFPTVRRYRIVPLGRGKSEGRARVC